MKRAKLIDRVKLLAEKRSALEAAAERRSDPALCSRYQRSEAAKDLEVAAIEYATVAIRYLGGDKA